MEKEENMTDEIDLLQLAKTLWHRAWIIILVMLLLGAVAFSYAYFFITPLYETSAMMYVNNSSISVGSTSVSLSDLSAAQSLVDTYIVILKSRTTLEEVISQADLSCSYDELYNMISASSVNSTEVFQITVTSPDPREAEKIANTIAELLPDKISDIVEGSSARIVDYAVVPTVRSSPSYTRFTAIGMLLGAVLSCAIIILRELFDEQIRDEDYLLQTYNYPMLATVPDLLASTKNSSNYYYRSPNPTEKAAKQKTARSSPKNVLPQDEQREMVGENLSFAASEAYKLLRTNLMFALPDEKKCRVVGLTSATSGEGKSTTTINLAYSLAQAGMKVLIIEADMRMPTISKRLKLSNAHGLSNLLAGLSTGAQVLRPSGLHQNLWCIPSGDIPPNPSELLGSEQMRVTLRVLSKEFNFILLDLPPVTAVSDPLVVSKLADGMILVVRQNRSNRRLLSDTLRQLQFVKAKLLGFVMTGSTTSIKGGKQYRNKYGYGYGYGESPSKRSNGGEKNQ